MGVIGLPTAATPRYAGFHSDEVGKWSVVYHELAPFKAGPHRYVCVWIIGTRWEVEHTLAAIVQHRRTVLDIQEALLAVGGALLILLSGGLLVWRERRRRDRQPTPL